MYRNNNPEKGITPRKIEVFVVNCCNFAYKCPHFCHAKVKRKRVEESKCCYEPKDLQPGIIPQLEIMEGRLTEFGNTGIF